MARKPQREDAFYREDLEGFWKALEHDFETVSRRFLLTLEVGKIEARHQDSEKPMIFFKTFDDLGLVTSVTVNPDYQSAIPTPQTEFTAEELEKVRPLLQTAKDDDLGILLMTNQLEKLMVEVLDPEIKRNTNPLFAKRFNPDGIPVTYRMNWPVSVIDEPEPWVN